MALRMRRLAAWLVVAGTPVVGVAGCGSSNKTTTSATPSLGTAAVAAQVPAAIKSKGLTVAADATYAPNEYIGPDGHTVVGMDADLANALGAVMGVKVKIVNATFATIIPGIQAGRYDIGASSFTDNKMREKTVDFVTYFSAGEAFLVKSNGPTINTVADLCGHAVSVEAGTVEKDDATAQNKKCSAAGKPAIKLLVFPDQNSANLALVSGRSQVDFADSPIVQYQIKVLGSNYKQSGATFATAPYGLALPKGSGLSKAVLAALKELMANGTYTAVLNKWGVQKGAISNPVINGATS